MVQEKYTGIVIVSTLIKFESILNNKKRSIRESLSSLHWQREKNADNGDFYHYYYPHTHRIFNILNPLYLNSVKEMEKVFSYDYTLVRDGLFPLMNFFFRFSRPGKSGIILLIHEELKFVIPKTWADNVLTYRLCHKFPPSRENQFPRALYLCASSCESGIRYQTFCEKIKRVKDFYGNRLNDIDLKWLIFFDQDIYHSHKKDNFINYPYFIKEILSQFGMESKFYTWSDLINNRDFYCSSYYYMADDYFSHSYSYVDHFFLSSRCVPFDDRFDRFDRFDRGGVGEIVIDILPEYEAHIKSFKYQSNNLWDEVSDMANLLNVKENLFSSEFFHHAWDIAQRYLFKN